MAFAYTIQERADLNAKASALLNTYPDVGSFIRQGLCGNPDTEALVYLRTALDPAPVITKAGDMLGLLYAARRWLRRNGIGPGDIISLFAPNCTATTIAYWASMSAAAVQPLNLLFTREAIAAQVNAVKARMLLTPPPGTVGGLYEKVDGLQKLAPSLERIVTLPLDGSVAFDGDGLSPEAAPNESDTADPDRIVALLPTGGTTGAPKVVPLSNRNVVSSAIGSMLAISARPGDRFFIALPLFHVGGAFCTSLAGHFGNSHCRRFSQSRCGLEFLAHRRGAAHYPRCAGAYGTCRRCRRSVGRGRHFAAAFFRHRRFRLSAGNRAALSGRLVRRLRAPNLRYDRIRWRHHTDAA